MNLTHDGITQPLQEWALDYGVPCRLIRDRLKRGWNIERAITEPMPVRVNARLSHCDMRDRPVALPKTLRRYSYDGKCLTATEWSKLSGVSFNLLVGRLNAGWPVDHALYGRPASFIKAKPGPERAVNGKRIEFNGMSLTLTGWAQHLGISVPALRTRLRIGWPLERAFTEPANGAPHGRLPKIIEFNGMSLTVKEWARRIGIAECTLNGRLASPRWTLERALTSRNAGTRRCACRPRLRPSGRPCADAPTEISHH